MAILKTGVKPGIGGLTFDISLPKIGKSRSLACLAGISNLDCLFVKHFLKLRLQSRKHNTRNVLNYWLKALAQNKCLLRSHHDSDCESVKLLYAQESQKYPYLKTFHHYK